jgi:pre-mRNA-splicing factor 18
MEKLTQEIARKKELLRSASQAKSNHSTIELSTRYIKQKDLLDFTLKQREDNQRELDRKRNLISLDIQPNTQANENVAKKSKYTSQNYEILPSQKSVSDVQNQLRALRHPISLFGETDSERADRLASLLNKDFQEEDEDRLYSLPNTFVAGQSGRSGAGQSDIQNYRGTHPSSSQHENRMGDEDDEKDDEEEDDDDDNVNQIHERSNHSSENNTSQIVVQKYSKLPNISKEKVIVKFFKGLLKLWEHKLNIRDEQIKFTARGKIETKTQKQCKDYIRPLFKLCKRKELDVDILNALFDIISCCEVGDFLKGTISCLFNVTFLFYFLCSK